MGDISKEVAKTLRNSLLYVYIACQLKVYSSHLNWEA
jgi:hypothetical protein